MRNNTAEMPENQSCFIDQSCCKKAKNFNIDEEACTLDPVKTPERITQWKALFTNMLNHKTTPRGMNIHFADTPRLKRELERLIKLEQSCCTHISWKLIRENKQLTLVVSCGGKALSTLLSLLIADTTSLALKGAKS